MYTQFSLFSLFFLWTVCRSAEPGGVSGAPSPATAMTADTAAAGSSGSAPSGGTGALGSSGSGDSGDTATAQPVVMEVLHLDGRPVAAGEVVEAALDYGPTAERYLRTRLRFTGPPGLAVSIFAEARGEHGAYYSTFSSVTWSEEGTVAEIFEHPQHPYTKRLMQAVPVPDPARRRTVFDVPAGDVPSPVVPLGRSVERVTFRDVGGRHLVAEA